MNGTHLISLSYACITTITFQVMGPAVCKSQPQYQTSPLSLHICPYRPSTLITPHSSPIAMTTTTDTETTQLGTTTGNNIFAQGSTMQSCQQDWHAPMQMPSTITYIHAAEGAAITKSGKILDNQHKNWSAWSQSMVLLFKLFKVQEYVLGKVTCPDPQDDLVGTENWGYNDMFAQLLITSNIAPSERVHTNGCPTSNHMWLSLQSMHESTLHLILTTHLHTLMNTTTAEGNNITDHISKLKQC